MAKAKINPASLARCLQSADYSVAEFAAAVKEEVATLESWLAGEDLPTMTQASEMAKILYVPLAHLYSRSAPREIDVIPDFRTIDARTPAKAGPFYRRLLIDVLFKRDWLKEHRIANGAGKLPFVAKFNESSSIQEIAADMRAVLGMPRRPSRKDDSSYFSAISTAAEDAGIMVMKNGIAGGGTSRKIDSSIFRGFCIVDEIVPVVVVNSNDYRFSQIFTLAHELAHIWIGQSALSNFDVVEHKLSDLQSIEKFCSKVAAEFLAPREAFIANWQDGIDLKDQVENLSRDFMISPVTVARRAFDLGLVGGNEYRSFMEDQKIILAAIKKKEREKEGGPPYHVMMKNRNSLSLMRVVRAEMMNGRMLVNAAAEVLGVSASALVTNLAGEEYVSA